MAKADNLYRQTDRQTRNGGIELLKVIAMFLIVVHHMTNSIWKDVQYIPFNDFALDLNQATTNIQQLMMSVCAYTGMFGNTVFFICSAWFLLDKKEGNLKKSLYFFADIWAVSVMMLVVVLLLRGGIDLKLLIKSLFPNFFATNWYATCYLLFLFLYPVLDSVIYRMDRTRLLRATLFLTAIYIFANFVHVSFFASPLILWTTIYFGIAYFKLYEPSICDSVKINVFLLAGSVFANLVLILATNLIGLRVAIFSDKLLYWNSNCSPLLILTAFSTFNLFRKIRFRSALISAVSKLTLLIYLFHENLLFRNYYRPYLWKFVYDTFGYRYIIFWLFGLSLFMFVVSILVSFVYSRTIQYATRSICDNLYPKIQAVYLHIEEIIFSNQNR